MWCPPALVADSADAPLLAAVAVLCRVAAAGRCSGGASGGGPPLRRLGAPVVAASPLGGAAVAFGALAWGCCCAGGLVPVRLCLSLSAPPVAWWWAGTEALDADQCAGRRTTKPMINPVGPSGPQWVDFFWKNMDGLFRSSGPQGLRTGGLHGALIGTMGLRVRGSFPAPPPAPVVGLWLAGHRPLRYGGLGAAANYLDQIFDLNFT